VDKGQVGVPAVMFLFLYHIGLSLRPFRIAHTDEDCGSRDCLLLTAPRLRSGALPFYALGVLLPVSPFCSHVARRTPGRELVRSVAPSGMKAVLHHVHVDWYVPVHTTAVLGLPYTLRRRDE